MMSRSRSRCAAHCIIRTAIGSTPVVALITTAAVSTASSAGSDCPRKSGAPGVSITWAWMPRWLKWTSEELSERCAWRSSGSWSLMVEPRSTLPGAPSAPAFHSRASTRLVLPAVAGPTRARVRIAAISAGVGIAISLAGKTKEHVKPRKQAVGSADGSCPKVNRGAVLHHVSTRSLSWAHDTGKSAKTTPRGIRGGAHTKQLGSRRQRKLLRRRVHDVSDSSITAASHGEEPSRERLGPAAARRQGRLG